MTDELSSFLRYERCSLNILENEFHVTKMPSDFRPYAGIFS